MPDNERINLFSAVLSSGKLYNYIPRNGNCFNKEIYEAYESNEDTEELIYNKDEMIKEICEIF